MNCPSCHGSCIEEHWDDDYQEYRERSCTTCQGTGQVNSIDTPEFEDRPEDMSRLAMYGSNRAQQESKMNESRERHEATVNVANPEEAVAHARRWNLKATQATVGHPHDVTFEGNYGDLMNFLTEYLSMSSAEADLVVDRAPEGDDDCPDCGAPPGQPHDPRCQYAEPDEPDPDRYREGLVREGHEPADFDKFMDRIVIDERRTKKVDVKEEDNPQRQRAARHQDRPLNKVRFGGSR